MAKGLFAAFTSLLVGAIVTAFVQTGLVGEADRLTVPIAFLRFVFLALMVLAMLLAYRWLKALAYYKRDFMRIAFIVALTCVAAFILFHLYFSQERHIKQYNSTVCWIKVIENRDMIANSIPELLTHLRTTLAQKYTDLATLPLMALSYLFVVQFVGFSLSIFYAYYLPACFFIVLFILRLHQMMKKENPGVMAFAVGLYGCILSVGLLLEWP